MSYEKIEVRPYSTHDKTAVIELWQKYNLTRSWNNPELDIKRKLKVDPELFLVGLSNEKIVASVMGGYDGHRGWVYYLAVDPEYQNRDFGKQIMKAIEEKLLAVGCPKINLMVRTDNQSALGFYEKIGYKTDEVISMGKRLIED